MVFLWVTEAIPLAATSLAPLILFPILGIIPAAKVSGPISILPYSFSWWIYDCSCDEKWELHKRIALRIIRSSEVLPMRDYSV